MKCRRPFSSKSRHSLIVIPAARAISEYAYSITPSPFGSALSLSLFPDTPSNFSNQSSNPDPASIGPERTSFVTRFQAITAFARSPPAEVPTRKISPSAAARSASTKDDFNSVRSLSTSAASRTSASISTPVARCGRGPIEGKNSNAPIPRVPV